MYFFLLIIMNFANVFRSYKIFKNKILLKSWHLLKFLGIYYYKREEGQIETFGLKGQNLRASYDIKWAKNSLSNIYVGSVYFIYFWFSHFFVIFK